jgi:hypothetical protein
MGRVVASVVSAVGLSLVSAWVMYRARVEERRQRLRFRVHEARARERRERTRETDLFRAGVDREDSTPRGDHGTSAETDANPTPGQITDLGRYRESGLDQGEPMEGE